MTRVQSKYKATQKAKTEKGAKKPYAKPCIEEEAVFETLAAGCVLSSRCSAPKLNSR